MAVSKYDKLWDYVQKSGEAAFTLTFAEVGAIAGVEVDHSFLNAKKELLSRGWRVGKISLKEKTVAFVKEG